MFLIYDKFTERLEKEVLSKLIWNRLETMYNLEALDENESIPFPNDESDFDLPDLDFSTLKELKIEEKKNVQKGRETPKNTKDCNKKDKTPNLITKDVQRRDSKDSKPTNSAKKETKKDAERPRASKGRTSSISKEEVSKTVKTKNEETVRSNKRPTRGSLKSDDSNSSGKASPVTVTNTSAPKRRRVQI